MDTLTDVLKRASVRGSVAASVVAGGRWGMLMDADAMPGAAFHAVTAGTACLLMNGRGPLSLVSGDLVLLPSGPTHVLASDPSAPVRPFDHDGAAAAVRAGENLPVGTQPAATRILCAAFGHDPATAFNAFGLLPDVVHVPALTAPPPLRSALQLLGDELAHPGPGASAVLDHIVHIMLIQLLRVWLESSRTAEHPPSWLRGLTDPVTAAALTAIHRDPAYPWTLETLARSAGVSRATLVRRFSTEVGCPPSEYLTKWRMELAANKLRLTALPVAHIARDVGYTSEYAFNRTFARWQGVPPGRYRTAFLAAESEVSASAEN